MLYCEIAGRKKYSKVGGGTVKGTFDDLSDDEKTKAFLQLLEYKLKLEKEEQKEEEKEEDEDSFHELWQRLPSHQVKPGKYLPLIGPLILILSSDWL